MPSVLEDRIKHIVVLMLENRSFDSMLGQLYPKTDAFDGLSGNETNPDTAGQPVSVWNKPGQDDATMTIPDPDPAELWVDMNAQIFGVPAPPSGAQATMDGFVKDYEHPTVPPGHPRSGKDIMHFFSPEQVPVMSQLARQFAVSDRWHASAPCQTWPNRFFAHTGTANGYQNNLPAHFPYEMPTIFNRFEQFHGPNGWKIYFHDVAQTMTLSKLWLHLGRFRFFSEFLRDAKSGDLPAYSFIEPRYFADVSLPNDQHPPHVVTLGEQLIADVYNALRRGKAWTETLLIITYDEHGGCFDHVPPPAATPPSATSSAPFNFDRYGVRVPAVLVSPYIMQGTVFRPPAGGRPFDHTSIIATLRRRFSLGPPLGNRDAGAPDVGDVLVLPTPSNLGPEHLDALPYAPSPSDLAIARDVSPNDMQRSLVSLAAHLPQRRMQGSGFEPFLDAHVAQLRSALPDVVVPDHQSVGDAAQFVKTRLGSFFRNV